MEQPGFFAILPANVRYDNRLKAQEKILYAEITALSNINKYCHAGNPYFAELYGVDERTIRRWLNNLEKQGYVAIEFEKQGDTQQRRIIPLDGAAVLEMSAPDKNVRNPGQKCPDPTDKNVRQNNTRIIIQENNACAGAGARVEPKTVDDVFTAFASGNRVLLDAALDFVKFRAGGKHPLTVLGAERACATLRRLATESHAQNAAAYMAACINQSIERGWEGLFAAKDYTDPPPETAPAGTPPAPVRNIAPGEDITKYL